MADDKTEDTRCAANHVTDQRHSQCLAGRRGNGCLSAYGGVRFRFYSDPTLLLLYLSFHHTIIFPHTFVSPWVLNNQLDINEEFSERRSSHPSKLQATTSYRPVSRLQGPLPESKTTSYSSHHRSTIQNVRLYCKLHLRYHLSLVRPPSHPTLSVHRARDCQSDTNITDRCPFQDLPREEEV